MGKKSRNKGYRGEHNLVLLLRSHGIDAKRVPLSGATEFCKGDLLIHGLIAEVKVRHHGFKELYKWLNGKDLLFVKADYADYLCVMPIERFIELIKGKEVSHDKNN